MRRGCSQNPYLGGESRALYNIQGSQHVSNMEEVLRRVHVFSGDVTVGRSCMMNEMNSPYTLANAAKLRIQMANRPKRTAKTVRFSSVVKSVSSSQPNRTTFQLLRIQPKTERSTNKEQLMEERLRLLMFLSLRLRQGLALKGFSSWGGVARWLEWLSGNRRVSGLILTPPPVIAKSYLEQDAEPLVAPDG